MRLGAVLPQAEIRPGDPGAIADFARGLEDVGYADLLAFEHVLGADSTSRPEWTGHYDHTTPFLEPLVLFAHLGALTSLSFVTDILVLPQRQTALVAKQAATLDVLLGGGRLRLGVGIGWNEVEYDALGVAFRSRARRLDEQIPLLRALWSQPVVAHAGEFDEIDRAGIEPRPAAGTIPIWIGCGDAPAALDRVGRLADGWIPHPALGDGQRLATAWEQVRAAAQRAGRDPDALGLQGHVAVRGGTPAETTARLARWLEVGASHITVNTLEADLAWPRAHAEVYADVAERWKTLRAPA
ncbi:TIGR03619 family F420-dependent LLM class oxidoreductase [Frankia sp. R82]|uniref:TIGR03619 family F420-dependent LLM class oxidoreductase n=1 Tax=Frankia sp. R82 TaxID=2950553 RepID=UPI002042C980|nr:TIGR03619 family F420-dependent LLM class oxidoreductase [Frankia sp. R82]MCM3882575.1 TIGR03619 family F420-dependent LLM class oxidoreductase [Frankia sp. R82]